MNAIIFGQNNAGNMKIIISLGHILKPDVIAEGIETMEEFEILRTMKGEDAETTCSGRCAVRRQETFPLQTRPFSEI